MNNMKIAAFTLLIAALPLSPAAFAHERAHDQYESQHVVRNGYHEDRGSHWGREHRHDRYCRHDDRRYHQSSYRGYDGYESHGWDNHRTQVVLPLPPLPPLPVFVVPKQHKGHIVLR
jgi:hypothetical protein